MSRTKSGKTLAKARFDIDGQIVRYAWRKVRKANRTISQLVPTNVSLKTTEAQQLYQVKRMITGIGNVPCSICSETEGFFFW